MRINQRPRPTIALWMITLICLTAGLLRAQQTQPLPAIIPPAIPGVGGNPLQPPHEKAALIRLNAEVNDMMLQSLQRRIDIARKAGCTLVIYEMDTYGGLVTSALAIDKLTKKLPDEHMNVVAWVHDKAYSAGAFISVSCQQIVMARQSAIGDCAPIAINPWGGGIQAMPATERAKAVSPILEDLDESAAQNHYDKMLLHSMVVAEIEIHQVRNNLTGETRYIDTDTKNKLLNEEANAPGGAKVHPWVFVETVKNNAQLLTLSNEDALKMGISKATVDNEQDLRAALNIRGDLLVLDFNWAENATAWLTQSGVRFMLFVAMLVLAWIEFSHPGATIPGIAAVLCLVLLVGAPFLTGLAQAWEIVLIVLGLGIIVTDLFVFGGIGLLAVPGFILMALGLIASFVPAEPGGGWIPSMPSTWHALQTGMGVVVFGSLVSLAAFFILSKYLYMTPGFRRLQLSPRTAAALATSAATFTTDQPISEAIFIGAVGRASTDLRPAGKVRFDQNLVDAMSLGSFIPRNTEVEVTSLSGNRVTVRPRPSPPTSPPTA